MGVLAASGLVTGYTLQLEPQAQEIIDIQAPHYPWSHSGIFSALDHASIRRGYRVYKEVCSGCHSMKQLAFRHLIGVCLTEEEVKEIAAEYEIIDGPDDQGRFFKRPRKPTDHFPSPFSDESSAKEANSGREPPDLSLFNLAVGEDTLFSFLTGYRDAPAGVELKEGHYFNAYALKRITTMPPVLYADIIEYEDGTPATVSQMAKDVCTFLKWAAEPEHDDRKRMGMKTLTILSFILLASWYHKRLSWAVVASKKIIYKT